MASVTASSSNAVTSRTPTTTGKRRNVGRILEQTWIWTVVGYTLLRFVIAWGAFSEHGANVWIFGLVDIGTAWPYGKGVALVCKRVANSEWKRLPLPLVAALGSFFAPYAYLWFAAGEMPSGVRVGMSICVAVLFLAATGGVIAKSRKLRRDASCANEATDENAQAIIKLAAVDGQDGAIIDLQGGAQTSELIIDLTDGSTDSVIHRSNTETNETDSRSPRV